MKKICTLSKNNCHNCHLSHAPIHNSSKKQKINEIRHFKIKSARDADTRTGHRMHQTPALAGLKRQLRTVRSNVFPHPWRTHQRRGISVSG